MGYTIFILILHVLVAWAYYDLANKHDRHKWLFACIGLASYYIGKLVMTLILYLILLSKVATSGESEEFGFWTLGAIFLFGVSVCFGLFQVLDHRWSKSPKIRTSSSDILDDDILSQV